MSLGLSPTPGPSRAPATPSFAAQRTICSGVLVTTVAIGFAASAMRSATPDDEPFRELDSLITMMAPATVVIAFGLRWLYRRRASLLEGEPRRKMMFLSRLISLAPLEAAALIASVAYYLGAPATPALAVMIAMPALMLVFVPVTDPDAAERREVD
ncbi:MAG: hypothetical protein CMJ88_13480 [Planctomycetes bacterium]|nr:hypothetical protein [Planctomycetota bacterium]